MDVTFSEGTNKETLYNHYSTTSNIPMCIVRSYNCVSIGKEQLTYYQENYSNSFFHRTLTKSSNKSIMNDQDRDRCRRKGHCGNFTMIGSKYKETNLFFSKWWFKISILLFYGVADIG